MNNFKIDNVLGRQVLVSSDRTSKPSLEENSLSRSCPFCNDNTNELETVILTQGEHWPVKVVNNKYPIVTLDKGDVRGIHYVVIEGPEHNKTLNKYTKENFISIFKAYKEITKKLEEKEEIKYIQIFKNYKKEAGISLEHPHSQIVALNIFPQFIKDKNNEKISFKGKTLIEKKYFNLIVPEVQILDYSLRIYSKYNKNSFTDLDDDEIVELSEMVILAINMINKLLGDVALNICYYFCGKTNNHLTFFVDIIPRRAGFAGFELATNITINTIPAEKCYEKFHNVLKESK